VWYPAADDAVAGKQKATYDQTTPLPDNLKALVPAEFNTVVTMDAFTDVAASAKGPFPVVLFSHGFSGFRDQSTFLTTWLASWGMVVAAPDHPTRDLQGVLAPSAHAETDTADLSATLDLLQSENTRAASLLHGHIDLGHVAAVGHSAGGATVIKFASDPRVDGYVSLASGNALETGRGAPSTTIPEPSKPSLFMAGADDTVVPPATTRAAFSTAPAPSYLWVIAGAGHNAFADLCIAAKGHGGLIALADSAGIGSLIPSGLRRLATDGCVPPAVAVTKTWPVIDQAVTSFLRNLFGLDPKPVGLGPAGARTVSGVTVTISVRPG
jgi:predicted dienelactone hydrolase